MLSDAPRNRDRRAPNAAGTPSAARSAAGASQRRERTFALATQSSSARTTRAAGARGTGRLGAGPRVAETDFAGPRFAPSSATCLTSPRTTEARTTGARAAEARATLIHTAPELPFAERLLTGDSAGDTLGRSAAQIAARREAVSAIGAVGARTESTSNRAAMKRLADSPLLSLLFFSTLIAMTFLI